MRNTELWVSLLRMDTLSENAKRSREERGLDFRQCRKWGFFILSCSPLATVRLSIPLPKNPLSAPLHSAQTISLSTKGVKSLRSQSETILF